MKRFLAFMGVALFVVGVLASTATADSNGQKPGQDPIQLAQLALTRCANAGKTNKIEEFDVQGGFPIGVGFSGLVAIDDCHIATGPYFTAAQITAIQNAAGPGFCWDGIVQSCLPPVTGGCVRLGGTSLGGVMCEIDPGNSGAHNQGGGVLLP